MDHRLTPDEHRPAQPSSAGITRRTFMRYVGYGVTTAAMTRALGPLARAADAADAAMTGGWVGSTGEPVWEPVRYPLPLPSDPGAAADDAARLAEYGVKDALQLPAGFRYDVVAKWGDVFGPPDKPDQQVRFGYNSDYTGLVPIAGTADEFYLLVNHEYVSARPWLQGFEAVHGKSPVDADGKAGGAALADEFGLDLLDADQVKNMNPTLLAAARTVCAVGMSDLGVSVLRVRRLLNGSFEVIRDAPDHFRIAGASTQNVPSNSLGFTGPAKHLLGEPRGTFANCSGATTPWGTFLTCEENFQDQVPEFVTPDGRPLAGDKKNFRGLGIGHATKLPFEFEGLGTGIEPPLDGRQYGWVCEVDPVNRTMKKHTALGRFRHENVAIRCEAGKPLACYMGDDRRGGHVWKFVSEGVVLDPKDPANSRLLENGTLYVARWTADYKGEWVSLTRNTPVRPPDAEHTSSRHVWLPARPSGGHEAVGSGSAATTAAVDWYERAAQFGRTHARMGDHYPTWPSLLTLVSQSEVNDPNGVLLLDAYVMANAIGGTPAARPEDIEIHPVDQSVYIAFTDSTGSGDGSPDVRIFPDSRGENSRQYGAIYRIVEAANDPAATTFTWGKFVSSGEAHEGGGGFACADNLVFDPAANLWMVCDITTPRHNFPVTRDGADKTNPGNTAFMGAFGNNAMFVIPTAGPRAGQPFCFAIGPMECELTGPTFTPDGRSLLVSVQHPGELNGTHGGNGMKKQNGINQPDAETRKMKLAARDGSIFEQTRVVPIGSNFPGGVPGQTPSPCVVAIRRET